VTLEMWGEQTIWDRHGEALEGSTNPTIKERKECHRYWRALTGYGRM